MLQRFRQSLSTRPHSRPHSSTWNARKLERRKPDRPLRLAAVGAAHPPLRRVFHVDVLDDIVEALAEHLVAELYVIDPIVLDDRSEEHTSELQSLTRTSYAVFCLKKKKHKHKHLH